MVHRVETFREDKEIAVLQSLKVTHPSNIPNRFYEAVKLKNWMCGLCMFFANPVTYLVISNNIIK